MANQSSDARLSTEYRELLESVSALLQEGRRSAARTVNAILTTTYWLVGRRLVEFEQGGRERAAYGSELLKRLSSDLGNRLGRGFSERNLEQMRLFYLHWTNPQTLSANSSQEMRAAISQTPSARFDLGDMPAFSLSWSHYVRLLSVPDANARRPYEEEALRGGWSVRQLDRQISTLSFQRSRSEQSMGELEQGAVNFEIKDPFVLEFLGLKDEYSEADLEDALIREVGAISSGAGQRLCFHRAPKAIEGWY